MHEGLPRILFLLGMKKGEGMVHCSLKVGYGYPLKITPTPLALPPPCSIFLGENNNGRCFFHIEPTWVPFKALEYADRVCSTVICHNKDD